MQRANNHTEKRCAVKHQSEAWHVSLRRDEGERQRNAEGETHRVQMRSGEVSVPIRIRRDDVCGVGHKYAGNDDRHEPTRSISPTRNVAVQDSVGKEAQKLKQRDAAERGRREPERSGIRRDTRDGEAHSCVTEQEGTVDADDRADGHRGQRRARQHQRWAQQTDRGQRHAKDGAGGCGRRPPPCEVELSAHLSVAAHREHHVRHEGCGDPNHASSDGKPQEQENARDRFKRGASREHRFQHRWWVGLGWSS